MAHSHPHASGHLRAKSRPLAKALGCALLLLASTTAHADGNVWMLRTGSIGCPSREIARHVLAAPREERAATALQQACVLLPEGERLLDRMEFGLGFNELLRVERHDRRILFVPTSDLMPDPGIGSHFDDRDQ